MVRTDAERIYLTEWPTDLWLFRIDRPPHAAMMAPEALALSQVMRFQSGITAEPITMPILVKRVRAGGSRLRKRRQLASPAPRSGYSRPEDSQ